MLFYDIISINFTIRNKGFIIVFKFQGRTREKLSPAPPGGGLGSLKPSGLPSLKPDEKKGSCQKYTGSACSAVSTTGLLDIYVELSDIRAMAALH